MRLVQQLYLWLPASLPACFSLWSHIEGHSAGVRPPRSDEGRSEQQHTRGFASAKRHAGLLKTRAHTCVGPATHTPDPGAFYKVCVCVSMWVNEYDVECSGMWTGMLRYMIVSHRDMLLQVLSRAQLVVCYKAKDLLCTALRFYKQDLNWKQGKQH